MRSYIKSRQQYFKSGIIKYEDDVKLIIESSGTYHNDALWGDTMVGMLFSSIFRLAKHGVDKVSIAIKLNVLKSCFSKEILKVATKNSKEVSTKVNNMYLYGPVVELLDYINNAPVITDQDLKISIGNYILILEDNVDEKDSTLKKQFIDKLNLLKDKISDIKGSDIENANTEHNINNTKVNPIEIFNKILSDDKLIINSLLSKNNEIVFQNFMIGLKDLLLNKDTGAYAINYFDQTLIDNLNKLSIFQKNGKGLLIKQATKTEHTPVTTPLKSKGQQLNQQIAKPKLVTTEESMLFEEFVGDPDFYDSLKTIFSNKQNLNLLIQGLNNFFNKEKRIKPEELKNRFFSKSLSKFKMDSETSDSEVETQHTLDSKEIKQLDKENIKKIVKEVGFEDIKKYEEETIITKEEDVKVKEESKKVKFDPLKVVRIFNDAYRLYTVNKIPTGRSGGEVSVARQNRYEPIDGKFRNIALFKKWNDGVLKIMSDDAFKESFDNNKGIVEFMNNMLDNNKMFEKGEQRSYLNKHFGIKTNSEDLWSTDDPDKIKKTTLSETVSDTLSFSATTDEGKTIVIDLTQDKTMYNAFMIKGTLDGFNEQTDGKEERLVCFSLGAYQNKWTKVKFSLNNQNFLKGYDTTVKLVDNNNLNRNNKVYVGLVKGAGQSKRIAPGENINIYFYDNVNKEAKKLTIIANKQGGISMLLGDKDKKQYKFKNMTNLTGTDDKLYTEHQLKILLPEIYKIIPNTAK